MVGSVTFSGLGSGLPSDIVDQLMKTEQTRLTTLSRDQKYFQEQKTVFSELGSKLSALRSKAASLQDASAWSPKTATSSNSDVLGVTASSSADAASHTVSVQRLATTASVASDFRVSSVDVTTTTGRNLQFDYNGNTYTVYQAAGSTLQDVAGLINNLDYGSDAGVSASVMNDGTGYRLVMTAKDSGAYSRNPDGTTGQSRLENVWWHAPVTFSDGTVADSYDFTTVDAGVDAQMTVDGITNVYSKTNKVSNVIAGATMELKNTSTAPISLEIGNDQTSVEEKLNDFITAYNDIVDYVNSNKEGKLSGDSTSRSIISRLRAEMNTPSSGASGSFSALSELGVMTVRETGHLELDTDTLDKALSSDFTAVAEVFSSTTGNEGLAYRIDDLVGRLTNSTSGVIAGKQKGLDSRIDMYDQRIAREEYRLERMRELLTKKFAALDQLTNSLNSSGSMMMQSLSSL